MKRLFFLLVLAVLSQPAWAKVVRFDIEHREDILGGHSFGLAGTYEKIAGTVYLAVDPTLAPNSIVTDITKAPTNDDGLVEFSAEFYIVKPKLAERGNGSLLLEVGNRGGKGLLSFFNFGERSLGSCNMRRETSSIPGIASRSIISIHWLSELKRIAGSGGASMISTTFCGGN